jgi:hypothetical protein
MPKGRADAKLTELIADAPWREAVTYRDTWPHEYVLPRAADGGHRQRHPRRDGRPHEQPAQ